MKWFWCELDTLYSLLENWLRDHTSWALTGIGVKIKSLSKNFWSSVLNFTTSRYSLLFSYSEIYIAHVIYYEWSRSVIIPLRTCIFPSMRSYCVWCVLGFCNQVLPDLQRALEWRTLQLTTVNQLLRVSHVLRSVQRKEVSTRASPIRDWSESSIVGWYLGIVQDSSKISYTCNCLFLINGFLGVVT